MLKSLRDFLHRIVDLVLPPRKDSVIVQKLDEKTFAELPKPPEIPELHWVHPLFHYKDNRVRALIWELKYKENTLPLEHIGRLLYEEIIDLISDVAMFNTDAQFVLLPIPVSRERRIERGYNQCELIAKAILENDTARTLLYAPQWFSKIKETSEQNKSQSKQERMQNLSGCFEANPQVAGKYIILIDDVVTTGSTLSEARSTLLSAGARDVFAFTIAH